MSGKASPAQYHRRREAKAARRAHRVKSGRRRRRDRMADEPTPQRPGLLDVVLGRR